MTEEPGGAAAGIGFTHLLVQRAVYGDLSPARRRRLHQRAANLVDRHQALGHRVAAAVGPDDRLAAELEAAGREAVDWVGRRRRRPGWRRRRLPAVDPEAADRRLLDALEILVTYGEVAEAQVLAARVAAAGPGRAAQHGCWARWISSRAGPLRPRPGCWRRGRPTTRPGTRSRAPRPLHSGGAVPGRGPDPGGDRMG